LYRCESFPANGERLHDFDVRSSSATKPVPGFNGLRFNRFAADVLVRSSVGVLLWKKITQAIFHQQICLQ
jgi:hypothetical protein